MCVAPIGAAPKGGTWASVRLIQHFSHPHGGDSVNANIKDYEIKLGRFDEACLAVRRLFDRGLIAWLTKLDVEAAYKQVPVRPEDWPLLGSRWDGKYYYELSLPFGLKSSGFLWELYAAALHYFFAHHLGIPLVIHYVDDFLFIESCEQRARTQLSDALALGARLGVPFAAKKTEGPTRCLTFLGVELDTAAMEARLPADKLATLIQLLHIWDSPDKQACTLKELQSLTGKLNFARYCVRPGRAYMRRLYDMQASIAASGAGRRGLHTVTDGVRADVRWWRRFADQWNGVSVVYEAGPWREMGTPRLELYTDACGEGYGAHYGDRWFKGRWTAEELARAKRKTMLSMPYLEMRALVHAVQTWSNEWRHQQIMLRSDCAAAVYASNNLVSRDPDMQALARHLSTLACLRGFEYHTKHVPGIDNTIADALSRGCTLQELHALLPTANAAPDAAPPLPTLADM